MRLAVLFDHLGPYHLARLRAAAREVNLLALETRGRSHEYAWDPSSEEEPFARVTLLGDGEAVPPDLMGRRLAAAIGEFAPEVVAVPGWSGESAFRAMEWCVREGVPVVLMSESTAHDEARSNWREAVKRRYVSLASAALVGGSAHVDYLDRLGMPSDRIFTGYDAVDNEIFASGASHWRSNDGPASPYFLASNRFIPKKNLRRLLEAYARYATSSSANPGPWPLVLLGDGGERGSLIAHAEALGLSRRDGSPWEDSRVAGACVYWPGFRQIGELPRYYAHAGAFVHASTTEQWGLVVNEAMASGLPVIVSNRCGCAPDLVTEGVNGWTFDPTRVEDLAGLMGRVAGMGGGERRNLGEAGRSIIEAWGPRRFASGLFDAAGKALEVGPKRARLLDRCLLSFLIRSTHLRT